MSTGTYHVTVGAFECVAVGDGAFTYPASMLFVNAAPDQLVRALRAHHLPAQEVSISYTCLVVMAGRHTVLVDTGAGRLVPSTGQLLARLHAEGIAPEDVDTVILSHGHPSQIGGATDGEGAPTFPNARYVMARDEWAFWTSEAALKEMEELLVTSARTHLPPLCGQLDLVELDATILPGIRAVAAPGHTPGHMALLIEAGAERLLYSADAAFHPLHLAYPAWYPSFDWRPEQSVATRRALFAHAAAEKYLVLGCHFPFPGLGHVGQQRTRWQWQPLHLAGRDPERARRSL